MGIVERSVAIKYAQNPRNLNRAKVLERNIQTLGDWIKVKRMEKNLTRCHLAAKMGIATALIRSWEGGSSQPDDKQLQNLANCLGFSTSDRTLASLINS